MACRSSGVPGLRLGRGRSVFTPGSNNLDHRGDLKAQANLHGIRVLACFFLLSREEAEEQREAGEPPPDLAFL